MRPGREDWARPMNTSTTSLSTAAFHLKIPFPQPDSDIVFVMQWIDIAVILAIVYGSNVKAHEQIPIASSEASKPNIIFILTDDQDVHLDSLKFMPSVQKHLINQGTYFNKHYCTTAVCCPSRATLWTGKAAHNTNITDVNPPYGGYPKFVTQGFNERYLPVWLHNAGYNTYYTGKLFNVHSVENYNSPYPAGWTGTVRTKSAESPQKLIYLKDFLLDPYTYNYMNSTFQRNREVPQSYEGNYVTDVLKEKAYRLLDEAIQAFEKPFFLTIAPSAPHVNIEMQGNPRDDDFKVEFSAPVSAARHQHLFTDEKAPRTKNFNPDFPSGANWLLSLPQQNQTNLDYNDHLYRQRLRALQAVDELVDGLFNRLGSGGLLENTYIVYSSDNGYHIGQHRLQPGKSCGYEEDVNIPLIIRGPGLAANFSTDIVTTHTDLAPTFLELLRIPIPDDLDGQPIPVRKADIQKTHRQRREHANVEYWGFAGGEGKYDKTLHQNNTYKAIRLFGLGFNLYYSIWCNNEYELYDMSIDPGQINNLLKSTQQFGPAPPIAGYPLNSVIARLDALLLVLKSCRGKVCREPWKSLHPEGEVWTLKDALAAEFDHFYEVEQTRVKYHHCDNGYLIEAEGPMWETHGKLYRRHGLNWDAWV